MGAILPDIYRPVKSVRVFVHTRAGMPHVSSLSVGHPVIDVYLTWLANPCPDNFSQESH